MSTDIVLTNVNAKNRSMGGINFNAVPVMGEKSRMREDARGINK